MVQLVITNFQETNGVVDVKQNLSGAEDESDYVHLRPSRAPRLWTVAPIKLHIKLLTYINVRRHLTGFKDQLCNLNG